MVKSFRADAVIYGIGIVPNAQLAVEAGLDVYFVRLKSMKTARLQMLTFMQQVMSRLSFVKMVNTAVSKPGKMPTYRQVSLRVM